MLVVLVRHASVFSSRVKLGEESAYTRSIDGCRCAGAPECGATARCAVRVSEYTSTHPATISADTLTLT